MKSIKESLKLVEMKDKEANVLIWFLENQKGTSRQIEHALDMRQPEVSLILSVFNESKWLTYSEIKKEGKGRPEKNYRLLKTKKEILSNLADSLAERIAELQEAEQSLKDAS